MSSLQSGVMGQGSMEGLWIGSLSGAVILEKGENTCTGMEVKRAERAPGAARNLETGPEENKARGRREMSTRRKEDIRYSAAQLFHSSSTTRDSHMPAAREGSPRGSASPPLVVILTLACISHFRKHRPGTGSLHAAMAQPNHSGKAP